MTVTVTALPLSPEATPPVRAPGRRSTHPSLGLGADSLQMTVRGDGIAGRSELLLRGELDSGNAQRLFDAVAWLRRRGRGLVIVDTRDVTFIDLAGYRTLRALNVEPVDGQADGPEAVPGVVLRAGPAVVHLERLLQASLDAP